MSTVLRPPPNEPIPAIQAWNPRTGTLLRQLTGNRTWADCLAFSPDGKWLAAASTKISGMVDIWDTRTWAIAQSWTDQSEGIAAIAFAPNSSTLATGGLATTKVRDALTGQILQTFKGRNERSHIPSDPPTRNTSTGFFNQQSVAPIYRAEAAVHSVAFSPDGKTLASGCIDGTVKFWPIR